MILVACGPSDTDIAAAIAQTETAKPTATPLPTDTPMPSATPTPTPTQTNTPIPTPIKISCSAEQFSAYLDELSPQNQNLKSILDDIIEDPALLRSASSILILKIRILIVETEIRLLSPPACAQMAHDRLLEGIELLGEAAQNATDMNYETSNQQLLDSIDIIEEGLNLIIDASELAN